MSVSGEQYWARSRYPGHPSSKGSVQSSRPTSPLAQSDTSPAHPLPVSLPSIKAPTPAPWYHAVTDDREQDSITSRLENASLHSFLQSTKNNQATDASSTAFSSSPPPSTSPQSVAHDHHPLQAAFEPSTNGLNDISRSSTPWSRSGYPRQATTETDPSIGHPSPLTKPMSDHDQEDDYSPTTTPERKRTLRRTLRSRRIISPVQLPENDQSPTGSASGPWKRRQSYPVHSATSDSVSQHPATPPPEREATPEDAHSTYSVQLEESEEPKQSSPPSVAWSSKGYPLQQATAGSTTGPASPPLSDDGIHSEHDAHHDPASKPVSQSHTDQPDQVKQAAKESNPWNRRASYPLQVAASNANLRSSPTPPQSSIEKESELGVEPVPISKLPPKQPHQAKQTAPKSKKGYPLQSPVSYANLRHSPTPPSSQGNQSDLEAETGVEAEKDIQLASKEANHDLHEDNQAASMSRLFRRQKYPLQAQANAPASGHQVLPERKSESKAGPKLKPAIRKATEQTQEVGQTATKAPAFRRPSYPLAALASDTDAQSPQNPPPSYQTTAQGKSNEDSKVPSEGPKETKTQDAEKNDTSPHQAYPLQEPVKVPAIHVESPNGDKSSTLQPREKAIAAKVVDHWRRGSYPLQSPNNIMPFQRPTTPQPPEEKEIPKPKKIHLPKNIRAVKDSEAPYSGRTIVILLDGTGDKFDDDNSNIVHLVSALKKDDPAQVTYYQAGIGTYSDGGLSTGFAAAADMAVGSGLGLHVRDAYHFLMHSYKEGDKICIFGFSRGAYTARCLAGMIHKVGLLPPRNIQQIYFAYEFYANDTKVGWKQSEDFKRTFCIDVSVHLLGCFDSVASVGFIPRQLPLSSTPTSKPRYFRHAMALDERRAKFKICRHQTKNWDDILGEEPKSESLEKKVIQAVTHNSFPRHKNQADAPPPPDDPPPGYHKPRRFSTYYHPNVTDEEYHELKAHDEVFETDVLEVWFAGAHADVGGGAVPNNERHKLAQIPLRWMIRQCFECNSGIIFKTKVLAEHGLDVHTLWPQYERLKAPSHGIPPSILEKYEENLPPRSVRRDKLVAVNKHHDGEPLYHLQTHKGDDWTPEQIEDFYDALCKINDQLVDAPTWWLLEFIPVEYKVPVAPGEVKLRTGPNLGRYRGVDDEEPNVHWTVLHRMQQMGYKIQARTAPHTQWKTVV